jgi:tripartite-type tricarboxylate transporter receptor subunit TctC
VGAKKTLLLTRAAARGISGGECAANAPPDGYTVFMTSGSIVAANPHLFRKMPFNPEKDLIAVTNVASGPQAIVVHPTFVTKTLKEFIALAKSKPRELTFGSAGFGTQTHLAAENFLYTAGIDLVHVPYKGEAPAVIDLMGGQIFMVTPNLSACIEFVKQGRLRALAVTSKERSKQLPNVPAASETLPGFENLGWFGFMLPAATPRPIVEKLYKDTAQVLKSPDIATRFEQIGMVPVGNTPDALAKDIKTESVRWARIAKERKLQID